MDLLISKDAKYIVLGNKIASLTEKKTYKVTDLHATDLINIFKNQSTKLLESDISKVNEINSVIRGFGYILSEDMEEGENQKFLFELEKKLNQNLITESVEDLKLITEGLWGWVEDKAGRVWGAVKKGTKYVATKVWNGVEWVGGKMLDGLKWLWQKGLPWFFDKLREFLYSPLGIAIEVALMATGIGEIPVFIVFAALLIWEIKELIDKGPSFTTIINVIFAALGCIPGGVFLARGIRVATKGVTSAKGLAGASRSLIEKGINLISKSIGTILSALGKGFKWVASLFGKGSMKWAERVVTRAEGSLKGVVQRVSTKVPKERAAMAISKGIKSYIIWTGVFWGMKEFLKTPQGQKILMSIMEFFGQAPPKPNDTPQTAVPPPKITDEMVAGVLVKYNPELAPIKTFEITKNPKTNDVEFFVINGKKYVMDMTRAGCYLIPAESVQIPSNTA